MVQIKDFPLYTNNLFSKYYLENRIQKNLEWRLDEHKKVFKEIKNIYDSVSGIVKNLTEPQLEAKFYRKIFEIILPNYEVQASTEENDFPDYAFFPEENSAKVAQKNKGTQSFYKNAFACGEVKTWEHVLDKFGKDKHNKRRNPSFQIWLYLQETEPKWGILSNGRWWRLYHQDWLYDCYYETDLIKILENKDCEAFKYFYYFFRKQAFLLNKKGTIFIENVLNESINYAKEVGDNLKENVYKAMTIIADGFFHWPGNNLDPNDTKYRLEVQKSAMRLLYRFLFLLYAEGKELLNLDNVRYKNTYSFYRLKNEIADKKKNLFKITILLHQLHFGPDLKIFLDS